MAPSSYRVKHKNNKEDNRKKKFKILCNHKIVVSCKDAYTDALALTGLQTLEERRLHLCTQFAKKCTTSEQYAGGSLKQQFSSYVQS